MSVVVLIPLLWIEVTESPFLLEVAARFAIKLLVSEDDDKNVCLV